MRKNIVLLFPFVVAVFLMAFAPARQGSIYYLSAGGSDANAGSESAPFATFAKAQSVMSAGDTLIVSGTFPSITITKAITVKGGVFDGSLSNQNSCVQLKADGAIVDGIRVVNCRSHAIISLAKNNVIKNSTVFNSVLEGKGTNGPWGSCIKGERGSENLIIEGNTVEDCYGEGIAVTMVKTATVTNNYVKNAHSTLYYVDNSSNVLVEGNTGICTNNPNFILSGSRPSGLAVGEETYSGWGAQLKDLTIRDNFFDGCSTGIFIFASDVKGVTTNLLVENNVIPSGTDFAISLDNGKCLNVIIKNNAIWKLNIWVRCSTGKVVNGNYLYGTTPTPSPASATPATITPSATVAATSATPTRTPTLTPTRTPVPATGTPLPVTRTPTVIPTVCFVNYAPPFCIVPMP